MPHRDQLGAWLLKICPAGTDELRISSGIHKDDLHSAGCVDAGDRGALVVKEVLKAVAEAEYGPMFRIYAFDKGGKKVLKTGLFTDKRSELDEEESGKRNGINGGKYPMTPWEAMFHMADRAMKSNERLVESLEKPMAAMANLFNSEAQRRTAAEDLLAQTKEEMTELEIASQKVSDMVDAYENEENESLRAGVGQMFRSLARRFDQPSGGPTVVPPATTDDD